MNFCSSLIGSGLPCRAGRLVDAHDLVAMARGVRDVVRRAHAQAFDLFVGERADRPRRAADDQRVVRELLALGHQRAGADDAVAADARAVHDDGLDADQRVVAHRAAVQHHLVADCDVGAQRQRRAHVGVQHAAVLDVAALADGDPLVVAAQHGAVPDVGAGAELDAADDGRRFGHPGVGRHARGFVADSVQGHAVLRE
jgi:hypothetical protein